MTRLAHRVALFSAGLLPSAQAADGAVRLPGVQSIVLWLLAAAAVFMLGMQGWMALRALQTRGRPAPDTVAVDGAAATDSVRVYYFHAVHCGHCRSMAPLIERMQASHRNLIKLDIADARELAQAFGVAVTPSFIQVSDGVIRQVKFGGQSEARLRAMLKLPDN